MKGRDPLANTFVTIDELINDKKIPDIVAPVYPGLGCGFFAASFILPLILKSVAIMVAPALCAYNARLIMSRYEQSSLMMENNLVFFLYEEEDIIRGAESNIKEKLLDFCIQKQPDVVFVVTSCLPEIVGEDIEAIVQQVRESTNTPVILIRTENFTNISSKQGVERTFEALFDLMALPEKKVPGSVNIIGNSAIRCMNSEIIRILTKSDLKINSVIPSYNSIKIIQKAPEAEYNILLDRGCLPLAERMKDVYGIPYFLNDQAFTPDEILKQYQDLGTFLSKDLEKLIYTEYSALSEKIAIIRKKHSGEKAILSMNNARIFDLALLLELSGIQVPVVATDEISYQDIEDAKTLFNTGRNPRVIRNASCYPLEKCLEEINPDYYLTHAGYEQIMCSNLNIRYYNLYPYSYLNGFERSKSLLSDIFPDIFLKPALVQPKHHAITWGQRYEDY